MTATGFTGPGVTRRREPIEASMGSLLSLVAAPTFAVMALLTAIHEAAAPSMLCSAEPGAWLSGMVPMYLLMSLFHAAPWLRLLKRR